MRSKFIFILITFVYAYFLTSAQTSEDSLPLNPAVRHGILQNGFQYYILEDQTLDSTIAISLIVKAGLMDEDDDQQGLSHLVEHLGMRATTNFPDGIRNSLVQKGFKAGQDLGANTVLDNTKYNLSIPSGKPALLELALQVVKDWCQGLSFKPSEIEEERQAVVRELSNGLNTATSNQEEIDYLHFDGHPRYKPRNQQDIKSVSTASVSSLRQFYSEWYRPINQAILVQGSLNPKEVEIRLKKYFSDLPSGSGCTRKPTALTAYDVPLSGKNKLIVKHSGKSDVSGILKVHFFKKKKTILSKHYPVTKREMRSLLINELCEELLSARIKDADSSEEVAGFYILHRAIQPAAGIDVILASGSTNIHKFAQAKSFIKLVATELKRVQLFGFLSSEFTLAKARLETKLASDEPGENSYSYLVEHYIKGSPYLSASEKLELEKEQLSSITLQELNQTVASWISTNENIDIVITVPPSNSEAIPSQQEVFAWIEEISESTLQQYKMPLEPRSLPALNFDKRKIKYNQSYIPDFELTKIILENGATILLKSVNPVKSDSPGISIRVIKTSHETPSLSDGYTIAQPLISNLKSLVSVGPLNPKEVSNWEGAHSSQGRSLFVNVFPNEKELEITAKASLGNIEPMLRLMYGYIKESRIDSNIVADFIEKNFVAPPNRIEDTISAILNASQKPIQKSSIDAHSATPAFTKNLLNEYFANIGEFTFVITGYFDKEKILPLLIKYVGALKGNLISAAPAKRVQFRTKLKSNNVRSTEVTLVSDSLGDVKVRLFLAGTSDLSIKSRLTIQQATEMISSVLFSRLREKEKGIYSVNVGRKFMDESGNYFWDIDFDCAPEDVKKLVLATQDELRSLSNGSFNSILFSNAKENVRQRIQVNLKSRYYWDNYLSDLVRKGSLSKPSLSELEILDSVTSSDISTLFRDFVDIENYFLFKIL